MNQLMKQVLPHVLAVIACLVLAAAYFSPQLSGKVVVQSDVMQYLGMSEEVRQYKAETGETSLWTNAMFGGMPTYQINTVSEGNGLKMVERVLRLGFEPPIGVFVVSMLCFYVLMISLGLSPWLGFMGAVAFGLTTNNLILYEAGHETKLRAVSYLPLVAAGVVLAFKRQYIWGGLLFAFGLGLNVMSNHVQMTYYFFLTLLALGVAQLIYDARRGELLAFAKASGALIIGGLLALGASANNLLITAEYSADTMRGKPILEAEGTANPQSGSEKDGLAWDYAMQWSNGGIDLVASFIPGAAGGGSQEPVGKDSETYKDLTRKGYRVPAPLPVPLYWGALPFTSGPIYFGIIVLFLFLMGLTLVDGPIKWWLAIGTLLTLMLSMGKNLEAFNTFFFEYVPLYNKFRTPNSVLSVTVVLMPLLALLALDKIASREASKEKVMRSLLISGGITAAACLFFAFMGPSFFDFSHPADASRQPFDPATLRADRQALLRSDSLRALVLAALAAGLVWAYTQQKISKLLLLGGLSLLVLFDTWSVGRRYLDNGSFTNKSATNFVARPADLEILKDTDPNYRVLDLTESTFQSSKASYFHKSIGGYHAAKLQRYQDLIDRHLTQGNQKAVDMLNARYFIVQGEAEGEARVQRNPGALGNAWFVSNIQMVDSPNEEINALSDFVPDSTAIVHNEFSSYLSGLTPQKGGNIALTKYAPNTLSYRSNAPAEQFAVFSEIWYGPDKGWQAYIDGQPAEHIRVNYLLRGMRVPAGEHEIVFKFEPASYQTGTMLSRISSGIIILLLLGFGGMQLRQYIANLPADTAPAPAAAKKPQDTTRAKGRNKR